MKLRKWMAGLLTVLLVSVLVLPTGAQAASQKSLKDVVSITVDKTNLVASDDYNENTASIKIDSDLKDVLYTDVHSKVSDPTVISATDGVGFVTVKALKPGTSTVTLSAKDYAPVDITFNVTAPSDALTPEEQALELQFQQTKTYLGQLEKLASYENQALLYYDKYRYVSSSNRKQAYYAFNKVIIPTYSKFLYGLKNVHTTNSYLEANHQNYVKGVSLQLQGLTLIKKALSTSRISSSLYKQANFKIDSGRNLVNLYTKNLKEYTQKFQ